MAVLDSVQIIIFRWHWLSPVFRRKRLSSTLLQGLDSIPRGCVIPRRHGYEPHEAYAATEGGRDAQDEVHGVGGMHGPDSAGGNGGPLAAATGRGSRGRGGPRHGRPHQRAPCLRREIARRDRHLTSGIFGANFIYPGLVDETTGQVDPEFAGVVEAAASRARVVEFFYGTPDVSLVETAHAGGALVSWQVGSRDEAIAAERARCDLVVAQGTEAGGHVRGKVSLIALLGEVLESVRVPVVAAGGLGSGRALAPGFGAGAGRGRGGPPFRAGSR